MLTMLADAGVLPPTIGDLTGLLQLYARSHTRSSASQPAIVLSNLTRMFWMLCTACLTRTSCTRPFRRRSCP